MGYPALRGMMQSPLRARNIKVYKFTLPCKRNSPPAVQAERYSAITWVTNIRKSASSLLTNHPVWLIVYSPDHHLILSGCSSPLLVKKNIYIYERPHFIYHIVYAAKKGPASLHFIYMYYIEMLTIKTSSFHYELISSFPRFVLLYCIYIKFLIYGYSILIKVFPLHY